MREAEFSDALFSHHTLSYLDPITTGLADRSPSSRHVIIDQMLLWKLRREASNRFGGETVLQQLLDKQACSAEHRPELQYIHGKEQSTSSDTSPDIFELPVAGHETEPNWQGPLQSTRALQDQADVVVSLKPQSLDDEYRRLWDLLVQREEEFVAAARRIAEPMYAQEQTRSCESKALNLSRTLPGAVASSDVPSTSRRLPFLPRLVDQVQRDDPAGSQRSHAHKHPVVAQHSALSSPRTNTADGGMAKRAFPRSLARELAGKPAAASPNVGRCSPVDENAPQTGNLQDATPKKREPEHAPRVALMSLSSGDRLTPLAEPGAPNSGSLLDYIDALERTWTAIQPTSPANLVNNSSENINEECGAFTGSSAVKVGDATSRVGKPTIPANGATRHPVAHITLQERFQKALAEIQRDDAVASPSRQPDNCNLPSDNVPMRKSIATFKTTSDRAVAIEAHHQSKQDSANKLSNTTPTPASVGAANGTSPSQVLNCIRSSPGELAARLIAGSDFDDESSDFTQTPIKSTIEDSEEALLYLVHCSSNGSQGGVVPLKTISEPIADDEPETARTIVPNEEEVVGQGDDASWATSSIDDGNVKPPLTIILEGREVTVRIKVTPDKQQQVGKASSGQAKSTSARSSVSSRFTETNGTENRNIGKAPINAKFPNKLCSILSKKQYQSIIKWDDTLGGIVMLDKRRFIEEVMPRYFTSTVSAEDSIKSFYRQLNYYGFESVKDPAVISAPVAQARYFVNRDRSIACAADVCKVLRYTPRPTTKRSTKAQSKKRRSTTAASSNKRKQQHARGYAGSSIRRGNKRLRARWGAVNADDAIAVPNLDKSHGGASTAGAPAGMPREVVDPSAGADKPSSQKQSPTTTDASARQSADSQGGSVENNPVYDKFELKFMDGDILDMISMEESVGSLCDTPVHTSSEYPKRMSHYGPRTKRTRSTRNALPR